MRITPLHRHDRDDIDALRPSAAVEQALFDAHLRSELLATLVQRRADLGLRQKDVARLMQTSQSTVSEFENGAADPHFSTLQRYARAVSAEIVAKVNCADPVSSYSSTPYKTPRNIERRTPRVERGSQDPSINIAQFSTYYERKRTA